MIFIPLMDEQRRVFGVFAVDNIPVIMLSEDEKRISNVEGKIAFKGLGAEDTSVYEVIKFEIPAASKMSSRVSFSFRKSVQVIQSNTQTRSQKILSAIPPTEMPVSKSKLPKIGSGINFPLPDVEVSAASSSDQFKTRDSMRSRKKSKSRLGINRSKALRRVSLTEELSTIRDEKIEFFQVNSFYLLLFLFLLNCLINFLAYLTMPLNDAIRTGNRESSEHNLAPALSVREDP